MAPEFSLPVPPSAAALTAAEVRRYSRHLLLAEFGAIGQRRLKNSTVLVVGAGGLGAPVISYLAAAGVGSLLLVDDDVVALSNLQRQVIHTQENLGQLKVESAAQAVASLNPLVTVEQIPERLSRANAVELASRADVVVDGTDNFATRYLISDACEITGRPLVSGAILRFDGQVGVFWPGHGPGYRDVFPEPPAADAVPACSEAGVLGMLCGVTGSVMANETVKLLTGVGEPLLGKLQLYDALDGSWRTIAVQPDPERVPVTELVDPELASDEQLCGAPPTTPVSVQFADLTPGEYQLVDVRSVREQQAAPLPEALLRETVLSAPREDLDAGQLAVLAQIPDGVTAVVLCRTGTKSAAAALALRKSGYSSVVSLAGGIAEIERELA